MVCLFQLKMKSFMDDDIKHVLGCLKTCVFITKIWKHGLPHMHLLGILIEKKKIINAQGFFDKIMNA